MGEASQQAEEGRSESSSAAARRLSDGRTHGPEKIYEVQGGLRKVLPQEAARRHRNAVHTPVNVLGEPRGGSFLVRGALFFFLPHPRPRGPSSPAEPGGDGLPPLGKLARPRDWRLGQPCCIVTGGGGSLWSWIARMQAKWGFHAGRPGAALFSREGCPATRGEWTASLSGGLRSLCPRPRCAASWPLCPSARSVQAGSGCS